MTQDPQKRFIKFVVLISLGLISSYLFMRRGMKLTPEGFRDIVLSMGMWGPVLYTLILFIRPFLLIPSIALFIAGGLAFGPIWGPLMASFGASVGGCFAFQVARNNGHDFVMSKLKLGAGVIESTKFSFSAVFLLSLFPIMPVTVINYGAGISHMTFSSYITAHVLGITPRAFAYGFFGSALMEIGSPRFKAAFILLATLSVVSAVWRRRIKQAALSPETAPLRIN